MKNRVPGLLIAMLYEQHLELSSVINSLAGEFIPCWWTGEPLQPF